MVTWILTGAQFGLPLFEPGQSGRQIVIEPYKPPGEEYGCPDYSSQSISLIVSVIDHQSFAKMASIPRAPFPVCVHLCHSWLSSLPPSVVFSNPLVKPPPSPFVYICVHSWLSSPPPSVVFSNPLGNSFFSQSAVSSNLRSFTLHSCPFVVSLFFLAARSRASGP